MRKNIDKFKKEDIKLLLETNDLAVLKGLIRIYQLQTDDEKDCEETRHHNGVGFSGGMNGEAGFLTSVAKQFLQRGSMTTGQFRPVKKQMMKYAGQLAKIANGKIEVPQFPIKIYSDWLRESKPKKPYAQR